MAAKLSYQAWRGVESEPGLLGKGRDNQALMLLIVGFNAAWQGSRARGELDRSECRITGIMLNDGWSVFAQIDPLPTPETARRCCVYNTPVQECLLS